MPRTVSLDDLAAALAPSRRQSAATLKTQISRWAGRDVAALPCDRIAGRPFFDVTEARAWIAVHIRSRCGPPPVPPLTSAGAQAPAPPREMTSAEHSLLAVLMDTAAGDLAQLRAAAKLAALELAHSYTGGEGAWREAENFKRTVEELRRAEQAGLDLLERRGELLALPTAKALVGALCERLVRAFERTPAAVAREVEGWLADPAFRALAPDERRRRVYAVVEGCGTELRNAAAKEFDALVKKAQAEAAPE